LRLHPVARISLEEVQADVWLQEAMNSKEEEATENPSSSST
jgi:hypothetical protein